MCEVVSFSPVPVIATLADILLVPFRLVSRTFEDAEALAEDARRASDVGLWYYYQRLLQTANGRYHFRQANLNEAVNQNEATQVRPMRFRTWLEQVWGPEM